MHPLARISLWLVVWVGPTLTVSTWAEERTTESLADAASDAQSEQAVAYFETHIRPLLVRYCYECHAERSPEKAGGLLLDRRSGWLNGGDQGPSVVPGNVEASLLIRAVRYTDSDLQMPPSQPLGATEVARLEQWVQLGAPGPQDGMVVHSEAPSDPIAGKSHWAFQPLAHGPLPQVIDRVWARSPIDRFILAKLEQSGLRPNPPASPQEFARRLSFQLTGLPPSAQSIAELESAQQAPTSSELDWEQSSEQIVDQLLASPQFGERWGRHWLDLARYADSNGLDENFLFREAWRYRNWVLDAINADLPYDRFLTEQLAGDLLPYATVEQRDQQRTAAGFLVVGPKVLLGVPVEQQRMDVADEHVDTIGRAVLGQTLGCARCHDHKFDPVPTSDYYALAGIFTSTRVMEKRHMLGQQRLMEQLIGLGADGEQADEAYETYWRSQAEWKQKKGPAEQALKALEENRLDDLNPLVEKNGEAVAEAARDAANNIDARIAAQRQLVEEIQRVLSNPPAIPPRAMVPSEVEQPADEAIRLAGQFDAVGEQVPRGFLTVLCDTEPASIGADRSGRLELAQWLTDTQARSGQLAARVLANRIWYHMLGRGLVRTVDNFGRTGESPSHPELLDYLAQRLLDSGWSIKSLVREIALSRTFAMSGRFDEQHYERDPDNQWLWRAHRRRLEPESIRDAMLLAAGQLDHRQFASTVDYLGDQATAVGANKVRRRTDFPCRSVYLPVIRNDLPEIFDAFDFTNPHTTTGARPSTMVPSQGLFMLNDEFVMSTAEATARRVLNESPTTDTTAQINYLFSIVCNTLPTPAEHKAVLDYLQRTRADTVSSEDPDSEADLRAWTLTSHALFASSRFQYVD